MATANKSQSSGILPVTASQTSGVVPKPVASKAQVPKLKVLVRRLPPGLTENEFVSVLGEEWKLGKGKVDWIRYKAGKDSKDPSKPSRPARAYLHLTHEMYLLPFSGFVHEAIFEDSSNTTASACLIGPPTVEFAPYGRIPGGRRRTDARAGTIDQDPEFMAFLEELANPINTKESSIDASAIEGHSSKSLKVTTTPLVQYLKDKKANKNKDAAAKSARKQEAQQAKIKTSATNPEEVKKKGREGKSDRAVDKAAKEAVKILNREALRASSSNGTSSNTEATADAGQSEKVTTSKSGERPRNAGMTAHIRMLQRDLGLSPAQAHRQVRRENADAQKMEKAAAAEKRGNQNPGTIPTGTSSAVPTAPKASLTSPGPTRNGRKRGAPTKTEIESQPSPKTTSPTVVALLKKPDNQPSKTVQPIAAATKASPAVSARKAALVAVPTDGATQAFVKHANPSQGVTESLLKEALERFGPVSFIEIDKRKGFAYVDFVDTEGLKKAMAANPITVAQGTVHVAQRKVGGSAQEKKPSSQNQSNPTNRSGRGGSSRGSVGGRRGGRGGRGGIGGTETSRTVSVPLGQT